MEAFDKPSARVTDLGVLNILIGITVATFLYWYIQWRISRKHMYQLAAKFEHPTGFSVLPIIGHAHHFFGNTEKILRNVIGMSGDCCQPRSVWLSHRLFLAITRPEDLEIILTSNKCLAKDDLYRFSIPLAGKGLFNLDVKTWKRHRKAISPTFNQKILDEFVNVFAEQCKVMTNLLQKSHTGECDVFEHVVKCSLDSVLETSMGVQFNCQTTDSDKIEEKITRGLDIMMMRMFNVPFHSDFIYNLTNISKEEKEILGAFYSFINKIVVKRHAEYLAAKKLAMDRPEAELEDTTKRKAFLDHLIQLSVEESKFTLDEITNEVQTFMIGGSDTSATVVGFSLICLGLYPEIQQKVYAEIIDVIGEERDVEYSDLPKLKYLETVIKETMRMFPIGPCIVRKVEDDIDLGDCTLPKGAGLVLTIINLHRSSSIYKDPMKFIPERFTPEESAKRHPFGYLPFSGGPRNCIGLKFGMMLVKSILASTVRKFYIQTDYNDIEDVRIKQSLIIQPVNGYRLRLKARHN